MAKKTKKYILKKGYSFSVIEDGNRKRLIGDGKTPMLELNETQVAAFKDRLVLENTDEDEDKDSVDAQVAETVKKEEEAAQKNPAELTSVPTPPAPATTAPAKK